jgi:hypothetical protein
MMCRKSSPDFGRNVLTTVLVEGSMSSSSAVVLEARTMTQYGGFRREFRVFVDHRRPAEVLPIHESHT